MYLKKLVLPEMRVARGNVTGIGTTGVDLGVDDLEVDFKAEVKVEVEDVGIWESWVRHAEQKQAHH